ncbi:MAG: hypothetical protein LBP41_02950 [Holosporaceae bacterium]|nr:hypothetical protein [Holosporaceae bacterium]
MLRLYIFNVGSGQCIFVYPSDNAGCCALIDCGCSSDVLNFIIGYLPPDSSNPSQKNLGNLTLTNYDEDHFSGICDLYEKVTISTVCFSKNLSSEEIRKTKDRETEALKCLLKIKEKELYTGNVDCPPYRKYAYSLNKDELNLFPLSHQRKISTNNLSQMVFIEYNGFVTCIPGDLESEGWEKILKKKEVQECLRKTKLFIASHHGRESGYSPKIFGYCRPECVVISDDSIRYATQENMSSIYSNHVIGTGILFSGESRKVLTTRKDGHLLIEIGSNGMAKYGKLNIHE